MWGVAIKNTGHLVKSEVQNIYLYRLKRQLLFTVHLQFKSNWIVYTLSGNPHGELRLDLSVAWLLPGTVTQSAEEARVDTGDRKRVQDTISQQLWAQAVLPSAPKNHNI